MIGDRLLPRFVVPIVLFGLLGALATSYISWQMHTELLQRTLKSRADVVLAALTANSERYSSAYELMEYVESIGTKAVGLKHIVLVENNTHRIVAATEGSWLGKQIEEIVPLKGDLSEGSWRGSTDGEFGFTFPVSIENPSIESLANNVHTAVIVLDGTTLLALTTRIKWTMMAIFGLAFAGLSCAFFALLQRRVLKPINAIHESVALHTDLRVELALPDMHQDEIGRLGKFLQKSLLEMNEVSEDLLVLTRAIEGSSSELYVIDVDKLTVLRCNKSACENLRTTPEKLIGSHIKKFAHDAADASLMRRLSTELAETGETSHTYIHHRDDGTTYPFEFRSSLIFGRTNVLVVIGNDVSERVEQEEALRRSEKRMQLAMKGSSDGLFDLEISSGRLFLSDQNKAWLSLEGNEIWLEDFYASVAGNVLDRLQTAVAKAISTNGELNFEFQLRRHSFGGRWLQARGHVQNSADGSRHLSGFISDITSRKVAESLVHASVSRLGAVLEHIADGIVTLTEEGLVCTVNPAVVDMFGHDKAEIADTKFNDIVRLLDAPTESVDKLTSKSPIDKLPTGKWTEHKINWAAISDGQVHETLAVHGDGTVFFSEISVTCMDGVGEERYTVVIRNITERKEHELALQAAMENAQAATRAKGDFLATMSHEIRTPMNGVLGMTQLLLDMDLTPSQKETARTIFSSGESLLSLINDILDFSKIEAGKLELEHIPFDLRASIKEVMDLTATTARLKTLDLYVDYPESSEYAFQGDVGRIRQVLLNLISNAIKFTASGHVMVKVDELKKSGSTQVMRISVHDSGPGISTDAQARLFDAFTQADTSTTRKYGGTGLGLAICKQLVELMGGEIGLSSKPGEGAEFFFTLPLLISEMKFDDQTIDERLKDKRMLVIDDNAIGLRVGCEMGRSFGMHVAGCIDPLKVIDMLDLAIEQDEPYDLLALDFHMPELDGLTLATNIRGEIRYNNLKIVMLTSSDIKRPPGLDGYTLKPLMREGLKQLLLAALFDEPAHNSTSAEEGHSIESIASGLRILVAEDNLINQRVATRMLEKLGCSVDVAANGREAVAMWQQFDYAMVFMDCQMPELDGFAATREIRDQERKLDQTPTPIVALTANAMAQDQQNCLDAGMDDYASKPVKMDLLQSMVVKWSQAAPPHSLH